MTAETLPRLPGRGRSSIGPGPGSIAIEVFAPKPTDARWDRATWDGSTWGTAVWNRVECDVIESVYRTGVTDESGILSLPQSGPCDLTTFDPDRTLDPSNADGPYFPYIGPGTPIRVTALTTPAVPCWTGFIDEVGYDVASGRGRVRAVDGIAYLAQADLAVGVVLPNTLRARVRAIVAAVGLTDVVPVIGETLPATFLSESFENVALTGWTPVTVGAGSGSIVDATAPAGGRVLSVVGAAGVASYRYGGIVAVPGGVYTAAGYTSRPAGATGFGSIVVRGKDGTGALVGPVTTLTGTQTDGSYEYLTGTYTAPADGSVATVEVWCQASAIATDKPRFDLVTLTGPDPSFDPGVDPPVAPYINTSETSAWAAILDASQDALFLVWLSPGGVLRFTSWGAFPDAAISFGCGDPTEGPWLEALETIEYRASAEGIRNQVRAWSAPSTLTATQSDADSITRYGARLFGVDRVVPSFATWAARILADRAGSGLGVDLGAVRPLDMAELARLVGIAPQGPQIVRVRDDAHPPEIDQDVALIGSTVRTTEVGWSFDFVTMIPRAAWAGEAPQPPVPPIPPPDPWHTESRTYIGTSDALLALTSGGAQYGAGASSTLPVGTYQGWTYRSLLRFPSIPWTKVRAVTKATLKVRTTTQVRVAFGSSPTIEARRITENWSAGSSSSPSSGNAVTYPGPATTSSGARRENIATAQNADDTVDVTAIVKAWAPASAGGSGAAQYGIALYPGSSSGADTTELWPVEQGGSARPTLVLDLQVFD